MEVRHAVLIAAVLAVFLILALPRILARWRARDDDRWED